MGMTHATEQVTIILVHNKQLQLYNCDEMVVAGAINKEQQANVKSEPASLP